MDLKELLTGSVSRSKIERIVRIVEDDSQELENIYNLIFDKNTTISWRAIWACLKICEKYPEAFIPKQQELINYLLNSHHDGKKRLLLSILNQLPVPDPYSVPLLDYTLNSMFDPNEKAGTQALSIKLGYKLSQVDPDLLNEYKLRLQEADLSYYSQAVKASAKAILGQINN